MAAPPVPGTLVRAAILVLALAVPLCHPAAAVLQRMMVAPGCYTIAPGGYADIDAYCLDPERTTPPSGAVLGKAPETLGETEVAVAGRTPVSLRQALAQHIVQAEGLGEHLRVRVRNLTDGAVQICFHTPTVLAADGGHVSAGLKRLYAAAAGIVRDAGRDGRPEVRDEIQRRLWTKVGGEGDEEADALPGAPPLPPLPKSSREPPKPSVCAGNPDRLTICLDR